MSCRILSLALMASLALSVARAEDLFKISLQMRHRFEVNNADFQNGTRANNFNLLRTRLSVTAEPSAELRAFIQIQDARVFGEETSTLNDASADHLDVHQAYFIVKDFFKLPLDLKAGRMEVSYGQERLMGPVGWHNYGRSFDGGMATLRGSCFSMDFFNLKEIEMLAVGDVGDKNVLGIYADANLLKSQISQGYLIWQRGNPASALNRYTLGIHWRGEEGGFSHTVEGALQGGKISEQDVQAFMFVLNLGYVFSRAPAKPKVMLGVDYLSGDDDPAGGDYKVFDTLYATNHKFYGFMDYFMTIPADTYNRGLLDLQARVAVTPCPRSNLEAVYHLFNAAQDYILDNGENSRAFGQEIDLTASHKYNDWLNFTAGASLFLPGDIFKEVKGLDNSTWFYLMTSLSL